MSLDSPNGSAHSKEQLTSMSFATQLDAASFFEENGVLVTAPNASIILSIGTHTYCLAEKAYVDGQIDGPFKLTEAGVALLTGDSSFFADAEADATTIGYDGDTGDPAGFNDNDNYCFGADITDVDCDENFDAFDAEVDGPFQYFEPGQTYSGPYTIEFSEDRWLQEVRSLSVLRNEADTINYQPGWSMNITYNS